MKNKKLNLTEMAKRTALLSTKEQKALKGGYKFFGKDHNPVQTRIVGVDIRFVGNENDRSGDSESTITSIGLRKG